MNAKESEVQDYANVITENRSRITEHVVQVSAEAIAMEMQKIVRQAAEPGIAGESVKAVWQRAAVRLNIPFRRVKAYWYQEIKIVPAHEADRLRQVQRQLDRDKANRLKAELEVLQLRLKIISEET